MQRLLFFILILNSSINCFAQNSLPNRIIGRIPAENSTGIYQIQVGAFSNSVNAENAVSVLRRNALNPVTESYQNFTRVLIKGIPANQVINFLAIIGKAGFDEVIIREDSNVSISEKWEFTSPESAYLSFEFNSDMNYLVVENNAARTAYFGEYSISQPNIINMNNFGVVRVNNNDASGVDITLSLQGDSKAQIALSARKAEAISGTPELDLFCRTWRVISASDPVVVGSYLFISKAGTYFFTLSTGEAEAPSQWRWYGDKNEEFEYSHNNWNNYGRAKITELTIDSLQIFDPGYIRFIPGYSSADMNYQWVLVPVNR